MNWLSALSTLITLIFALAVFARYSRKKGLHLLFWGFGLVFFGLGTLSEVILSISYSTPILKIWYLSGAMLTAAWLGQGSVFLLVRKPGWAKGLAVALILVSILAAVLVFIAPITGMASGYDVTQPASEQYREILVRNGLVVTLTILLNLYGTVTLVGGALYSAFLFWRKRILFNRMVGNILIATGALLPAMGGSFVLAGMVDWLYLSEFLGVVIMYLGFIQATSESRVKREKPVSAA